MTVDLEGKRCVVTGANTGIGKVTAEQLMQMGADVVFACRSQGKAQAAIDEARASSTRGRASVLKLDLASLDSVRQAADELLADERPIDILVNNAGLAGQRGQTQEGFELAFGVNHLGHFLLTELLLERIQASAPARIVNVSSANHFNAKAIDWEALTAPTRSTTGLPEYAVSKLANVLYTRDLAQRLEGSGVTTYALHPGVVASDVWRRVPWPFRAIMKLFMLSNEEGAATTLYCATDPACRDDSGLYYDDSAPKRPNRLALDDALVAELHRRSAEWVGLA